MDPAATLRAAEAAIADGDAIEAWQALADYVGWRRTGGFEPQIDGVAGDIFASTLRRKLAERVAS